MEINVNLQVVTFGQIVFKVWSPTYQDKKSSSAPVHEEVIYREPLETASLVYEVLFEPKRADYTNPSSTGRY